MRLTDLIASVLSHVLDLYQPGLIICSSPYRSGRNIANLVFNEASSLNTYDILRADRILMDQASLTYISEFYGEKSAAA